MDREAQKLDTLSKKIASDYKFRTLEDLEVIADEILDNSCLTQENKIRLNVAISFITLKRSGVKYV